MSNQPKTKWNWIERKSPKTGVVVHTVEVREVVNGHERFYAYRVGPDDLRTGKGGWRADRYDLWIAEAATPEIFGTVTAAKAWIRRFHDERIERLKKVA